MDILNLTSGEIANFGDQQFREAELEIRRALAENRMDIYKSSSVVGGQARKLKKNLARLLTLKHEKQRKAAKA